MTDRRRFDGYLRVSRRLGRQGPGYISPAVQRDGVQRWADYANVEIVRWHFDEDRSGGTQQRPGMREAIRRVETGEAEGIVCLKLNRFGRNVLGALDDIRRIRDAGAEIVFVEDQLDTSGPSGKLMLTVLFAIAEWERENLSASFEEAKRRAVARGAYVSRTPWGYERNEDGTLSPHPHRAPFVVEAFRLAAGDSLQTAMGYLQRVAPERRWTTTKVRRLLSQRSYLGETRNGDLVAPDTHLPLVGRAVWEAAQSAPADRRPRQDFPLSGLARCGTCGEAMVGSRGGKGQRVYRCSGRCKRGAVITAMILEDHVRNAASGLLCGLRATVSDPDADTLTLLERAVADAETELDAFAADMRLRQALGERYHAHLDSRVQAVEKARAAYREQARAAHEQIALSTSDLLDAEDPVLFTTGLRNIFTAIIVMPGHRPVGERVRFVPVDRDRPAGIPRPQDT